MNATIKPGDVVLAVTPRAVLAVKVSRVFVSAAGTVRVETRGDCRTRPGATFDARQCLTLAALENLCPATAEKSAAVASLAGAVAG